MLQRGVSVEYYAAIVPVRSLTGESLKEARHAVRDCLTEIQDRTPGFVGFSLHTDDRWQTAVFTLFADVEPDQVMAAATTWLRAAIIEAGGATVGWGPLEVGFDEPRLVTT